MNECLHSLQPKFLKYFESDEGTVWIEICSNPQCAKITLVRCEHTKCEWNEDGSILTCKLCGIDAT